MAWVAGQLERIEEVDRLALWCRNDYRDFHCGDRLEVKVGRQWLRGRVELSDDLGWYWTDNRTNRRLHPGDRVRIWDGLTWPAPEHERSGRDR